MNWVKNEQTFRLPHHCRPVSQRQALLNNVSNVGDLLLQFSRNELEDFALMPIRILFIGLFSDRLSVTKKR